MTPDYTDMRGQVIERMNEARGNIGKTMLTARQEHLVREFVSDDGTISEADAELLYNLLQSNSA